MSQWFSADTLVSSTNKIECHDITEILLKVAFNMITLTLQTGIKNHFFHKMKIADNGIMPNFKCYTI
jgi:hypothetical protein